MCILSLPRKKLNRFPALENGVELKGEIISQSGSDKTINLLTNVQIYITNHSNATGLIKLCPDQGVKYRYRYINPCSD